MTSTNRFIGTVGIVIGVAIGAAAMLAVHPARTAEQSSVEARLQRLEDREAIRNLIIEYGHMLDARDWEGFANLFAEDGEWIGGMGKGHGRATIRKMMEDTIGSTPAGKLAATGGQANFHVFTNITVKVGGDTATGLTKWMFVVNAGNKPQPFYLGHYDDTFIRENGVWKFQRRTVYGDIPAAAPNTTEWQPKKDR